MIVIDLMMGVIAVASLMLGGWACITAYEHPGMERVGDVCALLVLASFTYFAVRFMTQGSLI